MDAKQSEQSEQNGQNGQSRQNGHGENEIVKVRIKGHVQGVYFRHWTEKNATMLDLDGWVRNRVDGSVEALFCGQQSDVKEMVERCHKGPSGARVDHVTVDKTHINGKCHLPDSAFKILPTI